MFKVGQRVICKIFGEGVVTGVEDNSSRTYPVEVDFLCGKWECYTMAGEPVFNDVEPSLSVIE